MARHIPKKGQEKKQEEIEAFWKSAFCADNASVYHTSSLNGFECVGIIEIEIKGEKRYFAYLEKV